MKRYGYNRTSTREQHLDRGIKEITAYCEQNNLELEKIFTDQQTGKNFNRPRYQVLKEDVLRAGDELIITEVALNEKVKEQIQTAIAAVRYKTKMTEEWGMSESFSGNRAVILNFYGKAGTGKSMTAEPFVIFLPLKLTGVDGSPVRAVAVDFAG